jgi:WD40-like Beta Propeller Repeat
MKKFVSLFVLILISYVYSPVAAQTLNSTALFQCDGCNYAWFPDGNNFVVAIENATGIGSLELRNRDGVRQALATENTNLAWLGSNRVYLGTDKAVYTVDAASKTFRRLVLPSTYRGARVGGDQSRGPGIRPIVSPDGKWIVVTSTNNHVGLLSNDFSKFQDLAAALNLTFARSILNDTTGWEPEGLMYWWQSKLYILITAYPTSKNYFTEVVPGVSARSITEWAGEFLGVSSSGQLIGYSDQITFCPVTPSLNFYRDNLNSCSLSKTVATYLENASLSADGQYVGGLADLVFDFTNANETGGPPPGGTVLVYKIDGSGPSILKLPLNGRFIGHIWWSPTRSEFLVELYTSSDPNGIATVYRVQVTK